MLKYEGIANVGDRIRSYDFKGREDCYVEGVVEAIGDERGFLAYVILVDNDVFPEHSGSRVGMTVYVPMEMAFLEYDGRIVKL